MVYTNAERPGGTPPLFAKYLIEIFQEGQMYTVYVSANTDTNETIERRSFLALRKAVDFAVNYRLEEKR